MKPGDFVEAWAPVEDPEGTKPARRSFGVLLEVDRIAPGCLAYKVGTGRGFYEWFCHARKVAWTPEDMKRAAMGDA